MAEAAKKHTPREWSLDDYHRYIRITLGCGINVALCVMERRIVSEQALLICREYDLDGNPVGGAVVIDRFDFLSNYTFQFDRGDRVRVVTRKPDAGLLPGGITSITKFDESDPKSPIVRMGPGRVMDGFYTIVEQATSPPPRKRVTSSKKTKPTAPSEEPGELYSTQLIGLMQEIGLPKSGLRLSDVRKKVRPHFKKKYPNSGVPEDITFNRAYKKYKYVKDTSAE
jgi:hypothetical protein